MVMSQEFSPDRLRIDRDGAMMRITLSRAEKLNALDGQLVEALIAALGEARSAGVRLVVFSGEGKGFSGGFDFTGIADQSDGDLALRFLRLETLLQDVHHAPFVTAAFVHGACFGAAADLVVSCAHRIAAPGTRFRMPGLKFGVALGTRRLSEVVGRDAALAILSESKVFQAEEALQSGFLTGVIGQDLWEELVGNLHASIGALPEPSFRRLLRLTRPDHRDADMAELACSVAEPGLKDRIQSYLAGVSL